MKENHRAIIFDQQFREDLMWWFKTNKKIVFRILDLVEAVTQDPFSGMGKPEPLKYEEFPFPDGYDWLKLLYPLFGQLIFLLRISSCLGKFSKIEIAQSGEVKKP
ncbi:type II toxin-antitoxin system YoeB family toxin [Aphanothece sacrum]|uniref:Endoribonuclease YoeB n=1 Tax=Aphanothece sacrum FPU1 TaxID=1920663 RepID=A0A401IGW6_APHSA|nr:type II toxin-antitoxin system YoeB family toxin [Aphanothece sacrum]GBF80522.1 hypothetical protein AsFPU1_1923 [Aphanothece sacrum FPU1]GBF85913.1 toxin RelK [Aphanothece sacrum FPU3]